MKKTLLAVLLIASVISAQTIQTKSVYELKNDAKQIKIENIASLIPAEQTSEKKSGFLAIVYSLLLPGMGELYAGNYDKGKYFTIADGVCWGAYAGFNIFARWRRNDYKAFAAAYGGVDLAGKDAGYLSNISEFTSIEDYNRRQRLDRNFGDIYDTEKYYWNWASDGKRAEYRTMWESSEYAFNNVRFAVGALIVNRIISAIDAALMVRSYNKNLSAQTSWNVNVTPNQVYPSGLEINFLKSF
jgi:hypothetical protein